MKRILIIVGLAGTGVGLWLWLRPHAEPESEEEKPVAQVQVAPIRMEPISETLAVNGIVEAAPSGSRVVTLGYDCVLLDLAVLPGTRVNAGDLIMVVGPTPDSQLLVDSARGAAALAEKALAAAQERYDLKLETGQDLLVAQEGLADARRKLASYEARGLASPTRITAPEEGVVSKLDWQRGATVAAGTALVTLSASIHLEARLAIEATDASRVMKGQSVALTSINRPDAPLVQSQVRSVGGAIDPVSGSMDVRVPLPSDTWFAGEHVEGTIELSRKTALVVPRSAVLPEGDHQVLYTVKDHTAVKHEVQTGISSGDAAEVIGAGLKAGDFAVVVGNYELEDGMAVQVPGEKAGLLGKPGDEK